MSNTSVLNGFKTNGTRPVDFLRIKGGTTVFDPNYQFKLKKVAGLDICLAHIVYIGNGKAFIEYSETRMNPDEGDRWSDKPVKCAVIDLYNKTFHDMPDVPAHNGGGARHFAALADGRFVYLQVPTPEGLFMYRVDTDNYTAERGAQIEATFVGGIFAAQ